MTIQYNVVSLTASFRAHDNIVSLLTYLLTYLLTKTLTLLLLIYHY